MTLIVKLAFLLGVLGLTAGCGNLYDGEVTGTVASQKRVYTNAQGEQVNVRVDVNGRDTAYYKGGIRDNPEGPESLGIRYFSQVSITGADGRVTRFTVPGGMFQQRNGKTYFETRVVLGSTERPEGYDTPEDALAAAWAVVSGRHGENARVMSGAATPGAGVDGMIGSVTTAAK